MNKIKVIVIEPMKKPEIAEINNELEAFQEVVGGNIEMIMLDEDVALICNEEGKYINLSSNRAIYDNSGNVIDIIAGNFVIVYAPEDSEDFLSLPDFLQEKYMEKYRIPETFIMTPNGICVSKVENQHLR